MPFSVSFSPQFCALPRFGIAANINPKSIENHLSTQMPTTLAATPSALDDEEKLNKAKALLDRYNIKSNVAMGIIVASVISKLMLPIAAPLFLLVFTLPAVALLGWAHVDLYRAKKVKAPQLIIA